MVQNLKVDIIYHQTASDFEMEFNLCGCCRMRLLSDKTTDKKTFVKALARDVARSRVIIACGPLFGDDGLISIVAAAIGNGVAVCDNKTYGINTDDKIHIINGSTPLVTPNGYFGGCIIESGPQTIILLTENRAFRKEIMQNLIHPYIEEISYIPLNAAPIAAQQEPEPEFETAVSENEEYVIGNETEEVEELPAPSIALKDEHNIEFIMDGTEDAACEESADITAIAIDDTYDRMYTEVENEEEIKSRYSDPYKPSESDNMFIAASDTEEERAKKDDVKHIKHRKMDITIVILVLLLLLAILALAYVIVLRPMTMGISTTDYIKEIFGQTSSTASLV